ncbi:hypothetical protein [Lacrimispora algidixylanolytica]|uniref:Uncharacterized protein n=1 Tax=Lacrimispora algidixylanolytica TaxID=94868 RepID=A0A419STV2_9FIRM|nr:hypothetical protein [Lacrimispora algidixylanolytica]RKD28586.1 hypothetical protein BET01_10230 [Lacrimispora algidixylanolytica]
MIYLADSTWYPTDINPFTINGTYDDKWSAFIYDLDITFFTNVYPNAKLHVLRVCPNADKEFLRFFDFLNYELFYQRNVILKVCKGMDSESLIEQYSKTSHEIGYRETDEKYMVHSTTLSAWKLIQEEKALLSPNMLGKKNKLVTEIGLKTMMEPADYSDYIMLDIPNGCGELVVNSRNLGYVCIDPHIIYTPGVRLYFDVRKMFTDRIIIRDGLHIAKVKDRLPLKDYLLAAITLNDFDANIQWNPTLFTEKANELFYTKYSK